MTRSTAPQDGDPRQVQILSHECLVRSRVFDVTEQTIQLPSGLKQSLILVEHPGAVAIAARFENGELALVSQYRHAARAWLLEIPAGRLEPAESPADAARRELEEETGLEAREWRLLRSFFAAPGFCSEKLHLFLAEGLRAVPADRRRAQDADEELRVERRTPARLLAEGCEDAKTLIAAALLLLEKH